MSFKRSHQLIVFVLALTATLALRSFSPAAATPTELLPDIARQQRPRIQLALLLDTSNSMDGLIDQARNQLWTVVNELAKAKRNGLQPLLEVALFEYGNSGLATSDGYIRRVLPLTTDLDSISEALFALTTNGGDEYCGEVIQNAVTRLDWSASPEDLKAIYIAGNEPFSQGPVDFRQAIRKANSKQIVVNTIHCGDYEDGVAGLWQQGALLAEGSYLSINQNRQVVHVAAPQDPRIAELNQKLNATYIPYGADGTEGLARQAVQDQNAAKHSLAYLAKRVKTKTGRLYSNSRWDLADAVKAGEVDLDDLESADLPEEMQSMGKRERRAYVDRQLELRREVTNELEQLTKERESFVEAKRQQLAEAAPNPEEATLEDALVESLHEQAEQKRFEF